MLIIPETWPRKDSLRTAAYAVVLVAGSWWLLGQWAGVLRPLLLAVFMTYTLLPFYARLRRSGVPAGVVLVVLAVGAATGLAMLGQILSISVRQFRQELPALQQRFHDLTREPLHALNERFPFIPEFETDNGPSAEMTATITSLFGNTAGGMIEAATAALYLLFILMGAERLPKRVRQAYPGEHGDRILHVAGRINSAIISFVRAKVISSLILAAATGIVLALFGVKFITVWVLLTFLCNFIPYIGSVVAFVLPALYAALQLPPWTQPVVVAVLLLAVQAVSASVVEPMLIGRAVGLSPLVVLAALAIWGSVWGLPGMVLAVPLTVVLKIVLENIEGTRPLAKLAED